MSATTMTHVPKHRQTCESTEIEKIAQAVLTSDVHLLNYSIPCKYSDGTLVLLGRVRCYYHKQIAQTIVSGIDGVERIENLIEVDSSQ